MAASERLVSQAILFRQNWLFQQEQLRLGCLSQDLPSRDYHTCPCHCLFPDSQPDALMEGQGLSFYAAFTPGKCEACRTLHLWHLWRVEDKLQ